MSEDIRSALSGEDSARSSEMQEELAQRLEARRVVAVARFLVDRFSSESTGCRCGKGAEL